jgi:hypothetical protein
MNSTQPMVMAHHPQIAYAAQQTASHFAHRFNENNTSNSNISIPENQETNSNKPEQGIPIAQNGGSGNFYPVATGANGQMYYQNVVYAPDNTVPKKMEESSSSRSSSPKNSSCHASDNENSATSSLPDSSSSPPPNYYLNQNTQFLPQQMMQMPYFNFNQVLGGGINPNMMVNMNNPNMNNPNMVNSNMLNLNHNEILTQEMINTMKLGPNASQQSDTQSSKGSSSDNSKAVSPDCSASNGSSPTSSNGSGKKQKPQKPVKKVVVINLPSDMQSIESVTSRFSDYGEILLVRVLKPGKILPFDLKQFASKIHDLGDALLEMRKLEKFERTENSKKIKKF